MALSARSGRDEKYDVVVEVTDTAAPRSKAEASSGEPQTADGPVIIIDSPVRHLFGPYQDRTVREVLEELGVRGGEIHIADRHALDFVLRARVRTAVDRLRRSGGRL